LARIKTKNQVQKEEGKQTEMVLDKNKVIKKEAVRRERRIRSLKASL
jgi:hypothetical protein